MRLTYTCSSCKKQNYFKPKMNSRAELQMKFGDQVKVNCRSCGKFEKKHINRISAVPDNRLIVLGLVVGLLLVAVAGGYLLIMTNFQLSFWKIIAAVGGTIAGIPVFLWNMENKAVRNFNSYAIRR